MKKRIFSQVKLMFTKSIDWSKSNVAFVFLSSLFTLFIFGGLLENIQEVQFSVTLVKITVLTWFYIAFFVTNKNFSQNYRELTPVTNIQLFVLDLFGTRKISTTPVFNSEKQKETVTTQAVTKNHTIPLYPLAKGGLKDIEEVEDETYSKKVLGDGFAITPYEGEVRSPIDGKIVSLFPTKHAVGLKDKHGIEYLIHMGIDTIDLNGHGFQTFVELNQKVEAGDLLTEMDLDYIISNHKTTDIIFVTLSKDLVDSLEIDDIKKTDLHESVGKIVLK